MNDKFKLFNTVLSATRIVIYGKRKEMEPFPYNMLTSIKTEIRIKNTGLIFKLNFLMKWELIRDDLKSVQIPSIQSAHCLFNIDLSYRFIKTQ